MKAYQVGAVLFAAGGGLLAGVALSWGEALRQAEKSASEKYDESLESHIRALRQVRAVNIEPEGPHETEEHLDLGDTSEDAIKVGGEMVVETAVDPKSNPYWSPPDYISKAKEYGSDTNVAALSITFIDEDDFHEEDGREKEQVMIHSGEDGEPLFIAEGVVMEDWKAVLGDNLMVEFYRRFPPGTETRVIYVRNNTRDVDYEVIQDTP